MRSLAFVGCNTGRDVLKAVDAHDACWLFDPLQEVCDELRSKFAGGYRGKFISIVNAAVYTDENPREFHVYNVNGLSSSLGTVTQQAKDLYSRCDLSLFDTRHVRCVKLSDYLPLHLTTLIIDAQGCDLTILKSIEPWIAEGRIESIKAEADGDGATMYDGLPDNSEESMLAFMARFPHYECERIPHRVAWNPDFRWRLK